MGIAGSERDVEKIISMPSGLSGRCNCKKRYTVGMYVHTITGYKWQCENRVANISNI